MIGLLFELFYTFFFIGLFNFGGGPAMLPLIQSQVVNVHGWISESTFTDLVAISQITPGPIGINCATYVGYEVVHAAGYSEWLAVFGSATATFALVLPAYFVFFAIIKVVDKFHTSKVYNTVMSGLRPVCAGLIAAAALILCFHIDMNGLIPQFSVITETFVDWKSWVLFVVAFLASYIFKLNPILVILASGVIGFIIY